ncbi:MAG: hypothetical protein DRP69_05250 [Candidatus Duberdicusella sinuisediminis]|nr:MAG: hypothetical protein DRP69_05250 [Candidatus Omnitrophota bacterium]
MFKRSLTLLEILVGLCVASIILFSLVISFSSFTRAVSKMRRYCQAMFIGGELFFETSKNLSKKFSFSQEKVPFNKDFSFRREIEKTEGIFRVGVEIFWKEANQERNFYLVSYVKRKQ